MSNRSAARALAWAVYHDGFVVKLSVGLLVSLATFLILALLLGAPIVVVYAGTLGILHGWFWASIAALHWRDSNDV